MLELVALFTLAAIGVVVLAVMFVIGFFLKVTFRLLLLPFALLGGLFKVLAFVAVVLVGLVVAPVLCGVLLVVAILALPILLVLGLFGIGWAVAAA